MLNKICKVRQLELWTRDCLTPKELMLVGRASSDTLTQPVNSKTVKLSAVLHVADKQHLQVQRGGISMEAGLVSA